MTLDELAGSLPNGFHDAELRAVTIDYVKREARLSLDIWIGDDDDREAYRRVELTLTGLRFWIAESPDARYPYGQADALTIDMGSVGSLPLEKQPTLPPIPESAFSNWVFVVEWNAFIYVAAEDANLIWQGERTVRRTDDA